MSWALTSSDSPKKTKTPRQNCGGHTGPTHYMVSVTVNKDFLLRVHWKSNSRYQLCCSGVPDKPATHSGLGLSSKHAKPSGGPYTALFMLTELKLQWHWTETLKLALRCWVLPLLKEVVGDTAESIWQHNRWQMGGLFGPQWLFVMARPAVIQRDKGVFASVCLRWHL